MPLVVCQHQDHSSQTGLHLLLIYPAVGTRSGQAHNMSLDGSIEQLAEKCFVIQASVGVNERSDGSGKTLKRR